MTVGPDEVALPVLLAALLAAWRIGAVQSRSSACAAAARRKGGIKGGGDSRERRVGYLRLIQCISR